MSEPDRAVIAKIHAYLMDREETLEHLAAEKLVTILRAQLEALMAAKTMFLKLHRTGHVPVWAEQAADEVLAALRAAGLDLEEKHD